MSIKRLLKRALSAAVLLAVCLSSLIGCRGGEPVQTPAPETAAPETAAPETPVPETPQPEPEPICAVFEKKTAIPELDAETILLELLETDGELHFRMILELPYGRTPLSVYTARLEKDGSGFTAVSDEYYSHIVISGNSDEVTVDYSVGGEKDENLSGRFLPAEEPESRFPDIPAAETDPLSPGGAVESNISAAARKALGLREDEVLTEELCSQVTRLEMRDTGIACLDGIEYFTNLESIFVRPGYITDITPLLSVPSLVDINIEFCPVEELPDFSSLENLQYLTVMGGLISDVSPAANLHGLQLLDLSYNRIYSVAPLARLDPPERLVLGHNCIMDWESIADNDDLAASLDWDIGDALAVKERAQEILDEIIRPGMTDLQKQFAVCNKIHEIAKTYEGYRPMEPDGYEIIMNGRGVCSDYAQATALLMNMAGVKTLICIAEGHAWNMAEVDGEWYEFDCYWDDRDQLEGWTFFDLSYAGMSKVGDHKKINPWLYPLAEHSLITLKIMFDQGS